jgi:hypothetical protein
MIEQIVARSNLAEHLAYGLRGSLWIRSTFRARALGALFRR